MKLFAKKADRSAAASAPASPRGPAVAAVPGDTFFLRRLELPAGTTPEETASIVELQLEELAPFPLEQLYHGHVRAGDGSAVFVYAAYRRRFPAEQTEAWSAALFVLPDFVAALRLRFPVSTVVLVRSDAALTALYFEGGRELPIRAASRPLAPDAPPDAVERVRRTVLAAVAGGPAHIVEHRAKFPPEHRAKGLAFTLESDPGSATREIFVPLAECWAMDVRDPEFVAQQRKRLGFDVVLWRVVQGAAALIALLLVGEALIFGTKAYAKWLNDRVASRAPEVQAMRDKDVAGQRLMEFGRSGSQPFEMLAAIGSRSLRPESIYFTDMRAKGRNNLIVSGIGPNVAVLTAYENALKAVPQVEKVERTDARTGAEGTTFQFTITFRADAFARPAAGTMAQGPTVEPPSP